MAHKLFGYIDGSISKPSRLLASSSNSDASSSLLASTSQPNPLYDDWVAKDHALMTLINAALSPAALAYIVGCDTSKQIWETLERHYSLSSRTNVVSLKSDLHFVSKKPNKSIDNYIKRIKDLKDCLYNVSILVDNDDLVIFTLNGLPSEYSTFKTSMRTRSLPISFEELHVLVTEETALDKQHKRDEIFSSPTALLARNFQPRNQSFNQNFSRGRSVYSGGGRSFSYRGRGNTGRGKFFNNQTFTPSKSSLDSGILATPLPCQICNRQGHSAIDCFNRMNYSFQGRHPPSQLAAMGCNSQLLYGSLLFNFIHKHSCNF